VVRLAKPWVVKVHRHTHRHYMSMSKLYSIVNKEMDAENVKRNAYTEACSDGKQGRIFSFSCKV